MNKELIIAQTKKWIIDVVIGCNFCPFAAREVKRNSVGFEVLEAGTGSEIISKLLQMATLMNGDEGIETAFLILPKGNDSFAKYLKIANTAAATFKKKGYEGIYQLATFHPQYLFALSKLNDPAHYTNRSPYPMLQLLRESSVSRAVDSYPGIHQIPQNNIAFARAKGLTYMQRLWAACINDVCI